MRPLLSLVAGGVLALAASGCFVGTGGDLHQGAFAYACGTGADTACEGLLGSTTIVPDRIAVGAPFSLRYAESSGFGEVVDTSVALVPAAPSMLEAVSGGFRFVKPGTAAILGMRGDEVADFTHVHGEAMAHLAVQTELNAAVTSVDLAVSGTKQIVARPVGSAGLALAGALTYAWQSSDESVVTVEATQQILGTPEANHVTLRAKGAGTATVTVSVETGSAEIPVTVGGAP